MSLFNWFKRKPAAAPQRSTSPPATAPEALSLSKIEGVIAQSARTRHAIAVKAVYWRINDQIPSIAVPGDGALQGIAALMPVPLASSASAPAALPAVAVAPIPSRSAVPAAPAVKKAATRNPRAKAAPARKS